MEAKIDDSGILLIRRNSNYKPQYCIYSKNNAFCADWCPQFGEPELAGKVIRKENTYYAEKATLKICLDKMIEFDGFADERK